MKIDSSRKYYGVKCVGQMPSGDECGKLLMIGLARAQDVTLKDPVEGLHRWQCPLCTNTISYRDSDLISFDEYDETAIAWGRA